MKGSCIAPYIEYQSERLKGRKGDSYVLSAWLRSAGAVPASLSLVEDGRLPQFRQDQQTQYGQ